MKVLFIEDDPTDRQLVEVQLGARADITLAHAAHIEAALKLLASRRFDAAVLGGCGDINSFKKLHKTSPKLPVVVLMPHDNAKLAAEMIKAGAQDCLSKRHPLGDLLERAIRYAIERNRIKNELDRRMAELAVNEAMLRQLMDANSDAVLLLDGCGVVAFANSAAARMFGVQAKELEGREFGHPTSNGHDIEIDILRQDGTRGVADLRVVEMEWKGRAASLAALRDVTERVRREEALQVAEARLRSEERHLAAAQKLAEVGSFEVELETLAFKGSEEFWQTFGHDAHSFPDWVTFKESVMAPQERNHVNGNVMSARNGVRPPEIEYRFIRGDGAARSALQRAEILSDEAGKPRALLGVVRDVTELREAQARQREIEEQLRHAQRLEALGTLAGGIAHDLNNTLVPVRTLGTFLLRSIDPKHRGQMELIVRAGERATGLVREILAFSRKQPAEKEPVRFDILAKDILAMLRAGVRSDIHIATDLAPVPEVLAHSGQIYQVILNLVTNAAQAIGSRQGEILVSVTALDGATGVRLAVSDNGDGMSEETKKRIFEPFFTTKAASDGTGLGLSVVRGILDDHGAKIDVTSQIGKGTRFEVTFPAYGAAQEGTDADA